MDITIKQKKLIFVILSSALLIFILVFGINTYYKENKQKSDQPLTYEMMETAKSASKSCLSSELENGYRVCCTIEGGIKEGLTYDCSSQKSFKSGQNVYIIFDSSKFNIPYDSYFLAWSSDLEREGNKDAENYITNPLNRQEGLLMKILGTVPQEAESFILLKVSVYPDGEFDKKDEQVILYREAKIFKE